MLLTTLNPSVQDPATNAGSDGLESSSAAQPQNESPDATSELTQSQSVQVPANENLTTGFLSEPAFWFWPIAVLFLVSFVFVLWRLLTAKRPQEAKIEEPEEFKGQFLKTDPFLVANNGVDRASFDQALEEFDEQQRPLQASPKLQFDVSPFQSAPTMTNLKTDPVAPPEPDDAFDFSAEIDEEQLDQADPTNSAELDAADLDSANENSNGIDPTGGNLDRRRVVNPDAKTGVSEKKTSDAFGSPTFPNSHPPLGRNSKGRKRPPGDRLVSDSDDPMFKAADSVFDSNLLEYKSAIGSNSGINPVLDVEIHTNASYAPSVETMEFPHSPNSAAEDVEMNFADEDSDQEFEFLMDTDVELDLSGIDLGLESDAGRNNEIPLEDNESATLSAMDDSIELDTIPTEDPPPASNPPNKRPDLPPAQEVTEDIDSSSPLTVNAASDDSLDGVQSAGFAFDSIDLDVEQAGLASIVNSAIGARNPNDNPEPIGSDDNQVPIEGANSKLDSRHDLSDFDFHVASPVPSQKSETVDSETPSQGVFSKLFGWGKDKPHSTDNEPTSVGSASPNNDTTSSTEAVGTTGPNSVSSRAGQMSVDAKVEEFALGAPTLSAHDDDFDLSDDPISPTDQVPETARERDPGPHETTAFQDQINQANIANVGLNESLETARQEKRELQSVIEELNAKILRIDAVDAENNRLRNELETLTAQNASETTQLLKQLEQEQQIRLQRTPELDSLKSELQIEKEKFQELQSVSEKARDESEAKLSAAQLKHESEKAEFAELCDALERQNESGRAELNSIQAQVSAELAQAPDRLAKSEESLKQALAELNSLTSQRNAETAQAAELLAAEVTAKKRLETELVQLTAQLQADSLGRKQQLAGESDARQKLESELAEVKALLDSNTAAYSAQLANATEENRQLESELQAVKSKLQTDNSGRERQLAGESDARQELESELAEVKALLDSNTAEYSAQLANATEENRQLETELQAVKSKMESAVDAATKQLAKETKAKSKLQSELDGFHSSVNAETSAAKTRLDEEVEAKQRIESEFSALKSRTQAESKDALQRLKDEQAAKQELADELAAIKSRLETETPKFEEQLAQTVDANQELEAEVYSLRSRLETESELAAEQLAKETDAKLKLRSKLNGSRARAKAKLTKLVDLLAETKKSKKVLQQELDAANTQLQSDSDQSTELDDLRSQVATLSQENATLSTEFELAKSELREREPDGKTTDSTKSDSKKRDPDFFRRFEKRLKVEYKKRKSAQKFLAQAEEQRDEVTGKLRNSLDSVTRLEQRCEQLEAEVLKVKSRIGEAHAGDGS